MSFSVSPSFVKLSNSITSASITFTINSDEGAGNYKIVRQDTNERIYSSSFSGNYNEQAKAYSGFFLNEFSSSGTYYINYICTSPLGSTTLTVEVQVSLNSSPDPEPEQPTDYYSLSYNGILSTSNNINRFLNSYCTDRFVYTPNTDQTINFNIVSSTSGLQCCISSFYQDFYKTSGEAVYEDYIVHIEYVSGFGYLEKNFSVKLQANNKYWINLLYGPGDSGSYTLNYEIQSGPSPWNWTSTIAQNYSIGITAQEWNNFTSKINEFRQYKGLSDYSFTTAIKNTTPISANICNEAWDAINSISGHGTMPNKLITNGPIYASFFNGLKDALNTIT